MYVYLNPPTTILSCAVGAESRFDLLTTVAHEGLERVPPAESNEFRPYLEEIVRKDRTYTEAFLIAHAFMPPLPWFFLIVAVDIR